MKEVITLKSANVATKSFFLKMRKSSLNLWYQIELQMLTCMSTAFSVLIVQQKNSVKK